MGTEIVQFLPQGVKKMGFEVGNPMFKNTTELTFNLRVALGDNLVFFLKCNIGLGTDT